MLKRNKFISKLREQACIDALLMENANLKDQIQELVLHNYFLQTVDKKKRKDYGAV